MLYEGAQTAGNVIMKPLNEMSNAELWELFPIILKPHNPEYAQWYSQEAAAIYDRVGADNIYRINHIGSTAVKGLAAKPTVDILMEINKGADLCLLKRSLEKMGYIYSAQPDKPAPGMMFMKGYTHKGFEKKVFHLHVRYPGDWNELYFRDYLRFDRDAAGEYQLLKERLQKRFEHDRDGYTQAKTDFISAKTAAARKIFKGRYI